MKRFLLITGMVFSCLSLGFTQVGIAASPYPIYMPFVNMSSALKVWTISPETKIQPSTQPGSANTIMLEGAQRSYESYQVIVTASSALTGVNASASDLADDAGHRIQSANLIFFREDFIDFTGVSETEPGNQPAPKSSPTKDGRVPDPLIPFIDPYTPGRSVGAPFNVAAGLNQPVWLDVYIPVDAPAGTYQGSITVTASQQSPAIIPITLTVWNLVLPDSSTLTTYFGMHVDPLIDYHNGISDCSGSNCWLNGNARAKTIVKRYEELLHQSRADTWPNFVTDPQAGCAVPTDWTDYDTALKPYLDGSYWSNGVPSTWFPTPFTPGASWGLEANCTASQYKAVAAAWAAHLKSKGWFNKALVYAADEPDPPILPQIAANSLTMQQGDPAWKAQIMDTTPPTPNTVGLLNPALGIYTVALSGYDHWKSDTSVPAGGVAYGRKEWPGLFAQGIQLWFYESNAQSAPYPTFASNTLLGYEPRIMLWGAWYEKASGFLLWDTTAWAANNPWGPNVFGGQKSGDGVLVYPGNHNGLLAPAGSPAAVSIDGPIPSYRLKVVRAGLQDWALFKLADQHGLGDYARAQVAVVYGQLGGCQWQGCLPKVNGQFFWKTDHALMQQARHNIAQAIINATH